MNANIRLAEETDAAAMLEIYAPIVRETAISFELEPPSLAEFQERIRNTLTYAPWLVCEMGSRVAGYAYASKFRPRAAYQWTAEVTVYVGGGFRRRGIARSLYAALLDCLKAQGYCRAVAVISLPNPASVALHEALGFERGGVLRSVGHKHGRWHDIGWWELPLGELPPAPLPPRPLPEIVPAEAWNTAMRNGKRFLRGPSDQE